jgi:hypothetical protein
MTGLIAGIVTAGIKCGLLTMHPQSAHCVLFAWFDPAKQVYDVTMKAGPCRTIVLLVAAGVLALPTHSQRRSSAVFTSGDGAFQISYPSDFQVCTAGKMDPCRIQSYIPPCDEDAIVCFVYPKKQFEGTLFESAAFQVREIHGPLEEMTPDVCVTPFAEADNSLSFLISAQHPEEMIGKDLFVHGETGGAAAGHSMSVDLYRNFHRPNCYELTLRQSRGSLGDYDPPRKTLTPIQQKNVDESLSQILHSFRFLK